MTEEQHPLDAYFDHLCSDLPRDELICVILPNGEPELIAVMIDAEMDPVVVEFDCDTAIAHIRFNNMNDVAFYPSQLETLADLAERGVAIWHAWWDLKLCDSDGEPTEKGLRKWLAMGDSGVDLRSDKNTPPPLGRKPTVVRDGET